MAKPVHSMIRVLDEARSLDFYARGLIHPTVSTRGLDEINTIFDEMKQGTIDGRVVIRY